MICDRCEKPCKAPELVPEIRIKDRRTDPWRPLRCCPGCAGNLRKYFTRAARLAPRDRKAA